MTCPACGANPSGSGTLPCWRCNQRRAAGTEAKAGDTVRQLSTGLVALCKGGKQDGRISTTRGAWERFDVEVLDSEWTTER